MSKNTITLGEIADAVTKLSLKKVARWALKWYLILQVAQFLLAAMVVSFFAVAYPQKVVNFTQGIMPWEEVER